MEPASYILTAVQTLGLNAKNTMERQLIEFSIFGQLDTLCRQTGQGTAFQKKGQCYLLLVNMTQAQATGWLHDAQALLEQRTKCKVGFVCSPATAEMSAVPTFTAPCRDACRWFYFADRLPDTVLAMDAPPFGEAPADTAALHPLQEAVAAGFVETDREIFNRAVENLLAAVPPITDGRADAAVYHLLVCRRMVQARLERSGVQCAGGSNDLLDAARETADYPALEALFKKSLEELYGQMAGQVKKNEHKDIQKVTDYIAAHYRENLTLEVLAKHIHMNPFYFSSYFKKQLGQNFKGIDRETLDEIVDLLVETVCSARKTIRIAGDDYPAELVKSKFMKLDSSHIEFVFDCLSKNTSEIRNIKKYLLAMLFNAPSTINGYYAALVAHDMNTGKI